eukprot:15435228-Alexandrium_andersonii.AAC.1
MTWKRSHATAIQQAIHKAIQQAPKQATKQGTVQAIVHGVLSHRPCIQPATTCLSDQSLPPSAFRGYHCIAIPGEQAATAAASPGGCLRCCQLQGHDCHRVWDGQVHCFTSKSVHVEHVEALACIHCCIPCIACRGTCMHPLLNPLHNMQRHLHASLIAS